MTAVPPEAIPEKKLYIIDVYLNIPGITFNIIINIIVKSNNLSNDLILSA